MYRTASEEETIALGERLARELPPGAVVLLIGELGAGKTTLAKGIVKGLGAAQPEEVSSPTFTLIHEYGRDPVVYHVDLYRLENAREVESLGLEELFERGSVVLIEWGERFPELMPAGRMEIKLECGEGEERVITVKDGPVTRVPLSRVAHTRSGDKGDTANIGVIAWRAEDYPILLREVTAARVKEYFGDLVKGEVVRYELPNLCALNFLLHQALGGGGTVSLRADAQGKTFGAALLNMEIETADERR